MRVTTDQKEATMNTMLGPGDVKYVQSGDPWAHRSDRMKCKTCMWFVPKLSQVGCNLGRCRRHAPTMGGYPVVFDNDWCGDHKLDETKI